MVRRLWWRTAPYVSLVVIVFAAATSALSFAIAPSSILDGLVIAIAVVTAIEFSLVLGLSPYMGKREFLQRFGNIPRYWNTYRQNVAGWAVIVQLVPCFLGIVAVVYSTLVAPRGTSLVHARGNFAIVSPSGVAVQVSEHAYSLASAALSTIGPMGAFLVFHGLLLMYLTADRFLGERPELWPPAKTDRHSRWFGTFPRGNARN